MKINGIHGAGTQTGQIGMNQAMDSYSQTIQNQIANAQKQLQELSSNENMTLEEKMKKRQEIQQKINDLNMQLRQHQAEKRREKQQAKDSCTDNMPDTAKKTENKSAGLSQAGMKAIISADSSIKQANVHGSTATKMEGRARVLESEIRLDQGRGSSVEKKKEELADVKQKAQAATAASMSSLAEAGRAMEKTATEENNSKKADDKDAEHTEAKKKDSMDNVPGTDAQDKTASSNTNGQHPMIYTSVDIRL